MSGDMLTTREAARACKVCTATILRWVASGKLRAVRRGRTIRIPREALEEMR